MYEQGNSFAEGYAIGRDSNNGYGNGMFGGDWGWFIIILLLCGWGNGFGGFGGGFGGFGGGGLMTGYATQADIARGFDNQSVMNKLNGLENGLCDGFYAVNSSLLNGFNGLNTAIMTQGYETRNAISGLSSQLASCCCDLSRGQERIQYEAAKNTCDITHAISDSTATILNFLTNDKISTLTAENQALKFAASQTAQNAFITANQEAQTAELIRRLGRDCPIPAYVVPNPNCCYPASAYGYGNSCGCGC